MKSPQQQQRKTMRAPDSTMRVLHFVPRECWPLDTGAKLRNYYLAREMTREASVTLLTFSDNDDETASRSPAPSSVNQLTAAAQGSAGTPQSPSTPESALPEPEKFYERLITVRRDQGYTIGKIIRGALGQTPLPVLNYTTPRMAHELERTLDDQRFDIVQVESIHLAAYLPVIRSARSRPLVVCDWHNIESELMKRYSEHARTPLHKVYAQRTSRQLAALERRVMREFDAHVVVSEREREKLLKHAPEAQIHLVENGVDTGYYSDERIALAHADWLLRRKSAGGINAEGNHDALGQAVPKRRVLFVGSMDYHANIDGVVHFAREVWPQVHERNPELVLTIVGRDPAPEVRQLANSPGIEVTGTVDDVRPYYYDAALAVIPLRVGGGSRLKILEAMAAGVPIVSTTLGAEGIEIKKDENIVIADTRHELQSAIGALLNNEARRRKLIEGGRALVLARYDWSRLGALLVETYRKLIDRNSTTGQIDKL